MVVSNTRYSIEAVEQKPQGRLHHISVSKYEADWHSMLHTHPYTELFYVMEGRGSFTVDGQKFQVGEDDLIIVNPSVEHTELSTAENPMEYIVLGIEGMTFSGVGGGSYTACSCKEVRGEMRFFLSEILHEAQDRQPGGSGMCQNLFQALMVKVTRCMDHLLSSAVSQRTNRECGTVKRYLDANYKENISLDSLAQLTHINKYYLAHAFRKHTGMSPISYLIMRRVEESKGLLETTDYSISQIAGIIGFSSQSYFSQIFKKNTGVAPNEYRKRIKAQQRCQVGT